MPGKVRRNTQSYTVRESGQPGFRVGSMRADEVKLSFPAILQATHSPHFGFGLASVIWAKVNNPEMWGREAKALAAPHCHPRGLGTSSVYPFPLGRFMPISPAKSLVLEDATRDQRMAFYPGGEVRRED